MISEYLLLLYNLYVVALTAVMPLYTKGTWRAIGDTKYELFWNLSVLCLGIWLVLSIINYVYTIKIASVHRNTAYINGKHSNRVCLSTMDRWMLLYAACVLFSAVFSSWPETAWFGYREWNMGALSQLIFVGIYFFSSQNHTGKNKILLIWELAFFFVILLGLLHRLGIDPLGLTEGLELRAWEYSHMLSTIGNINWFCGYCSVAMALPLSEYIKSESKIKAILLYLVCVPGLLLLFIQGSDTGVIMVFVTFTICLGFGIRRVKYLQRSLALAVGFCVSIPLYGSLVKVIGEKAHYAIPEDGLRLSCYTHSMWWVAIFVFALTAAFCLLLQKKRRTRSLRILAVVVTLAAGCGGIAMAILYLRNQTSGTYWGNGRGTLWKLALHGFVNNNLFGKLIGVGPDCFAEYVYTEFSGSILPALDGHWADAVYTNAHNEWLNHLVNLGIMGTVSYGGIFCTGLWRYRKNVFGFLGITMYAVVSMTCFQQVLSTPMLFLILGICESRERRKQSREEYDDNMK